MGAGRLGGGADVDGDSPAFPRRVSTAASAEASRARSPQDRLPTAATGAAGSQAPETAEDGGRGGNGGVGVGVGGDGGNGAAGLGLGLGSAALRSTLPPPRQAVQSVASAGGDRLQRLAMAEIGFAEKELYAPKTGKTVDWVGVGEGVKGG